MGQDHIALTAPPATGAQGSDHWTMQAALIVSLCFALNMVDGMDVLILAFIAPSLQSAWHVSTGELSIVFSMGLAGMAVGGLGLAPLADRFGRRRMVAAAMALMACAMFASAHVHSVAQMAFVRLFVGVGIGTVLACIAAIAARVAPLKHRNFAVGVLQAGYPIGAMLTGFVTAWGLPLFGWQTVLITTAFVSALFVPLVGFILPRDLDQGAAAHHQPTLSQAIAGPRLRSSVMLWIATICGFMALYFITSWITKLAIEAGLPQTQAIVASAVYNFGAFAGTAGLSIIGTKVDVRRISSVLLFATAGVFLIFGGVPMPLAGVLTAAFVMGVTLQGGFNMLYPVAARVYPDDVRATGIGYAFGVGRIGAFAGPLMGGWALDAHLPLVGVFGLFCVPLVVASLAARQVRYQEV